MYRPDVARASPGAPSGELEHRTHERSCLLSVSEVLHSLTDLPGVDVVLGEVLDHVLEITGTDTGAYCCWMTAGSSSGTGYTGGFHLNMSGRWSAM